MPPDAVQQTRQHSVKTDDAGSNGADENMALVCHGLAKSYRQGSSVLEVLREINLAVRQGERIAIVGASGSGKSTLLGLLGLLDQPDGGKLVLRGCDPSGLNDAQISALRNRQLGFVYQFHHLLAEFTAQENVAMPLLIAGVDPREASKLAGRWLERVGLAARASHRPSELSGGERQRVAIARALVNQPGCVLMDEPTGNLDREAAGKVLSLLDTLSKESDTAFIVVTHDPSVAAVMDCIYELRDGILQTASSQSAAQQLAGEKQRGQR